MSRFSRNVVQFTVPTTSVSYIIIIIIIKNALNTLTHNVKTLQRHFTKYVYSRSIDVITDLSGSLSEATILNDASASCVESSRHRTLSS